MGQTLEDRIEMRELAAVALEGAIDNLPSFHSVRRVLEAQLQLLHGEIEELESRAVDLERAEEWIARPSSP